MESYENPSSGESPATLEQPPLLDLPTKLRMQEALIFHDPHPERRKSAVDDRTALEWIDTKSPDFGKFWTQYAKDADVQKAIHDWDTKPEASLRLLERAWEQFTQEQRPENLD